MSYLKLSLKVMRVSGEALEVELGAGDLARLTVLTENYVKYLHAHNSNGEFNQDVAEYEGLLEKLKKCY